MKKPLIVGNLEIHDPVIVEYLEGFDEERHEEQLLHAAQIGVLAIRSASPALDTRIVEEKFSEIEQRLKEYLGGFEREIGTYLKDKEGVLPKTLDAFFNPKGKLADIFTKWIGPTSDFAKDLDPRNSEGILTRIEKKVGALVDARLNAITDEFSLDEKDSAMARLKVMIENWHGDIKTTLGNLQGRKQEADKGHVKGTDFQTAVYLRLAKWSADLEDSSESVHAMPGANGKCKVGDFLVALGENSAARGEKIVFEVKDRPTAAFRLKDAIGELQDAKENRNASVGIFVYSKGSEPPELQSDFLKVGDDFLCTVDKAELENGGPLLSLQYAYKIARAMVVAKSRIQGGALDVEALAEEMEAFSECVEAIGGLVKQAGKIENVGRTMKSSLSDLQKNLDDRIKKVLTTIKEAPIPAHGANSLGIHTAKPCT